MIQQKSQTGCMNMMARPMIYFCYHQLLCVDISSAYFNKCERYEYQNGIYSSICIKCDSFLKNVLYLIVFTLILIKIIDVDLNSFQRLSDLVA